MRRIGLFLLVFVLTLQMSWAAVHYCDDERMVAHAMAADDGSHVHLAEADEAADGKADKFSDTCGGSAHGCHGLHHLVGQTNPDFNLTTSIQTPALSGAAPSLSGTHSRIERPNWLAA